MSFVELSSLIVAAFSCLVCAYAVLFVAASPPYDYLYRRGAAAYREITPDEIDGIRFSEILASKVPTTIGAHPALVARHAARLLAASSVVVDAASAAWIDASDEVARLADCHTRAVTSRHRSRAASYARRAMQADAARWTTTAPSFA